MAMISNSDPVTLHSLKTSARVRALGSLLAVPWVSICLSCLPTLQAAPVLEVLPPAAPQSPVRLAGSGAKGTVLQLEAAPSPSGGWQEIGRFHEVLQPWADGSAGDAARRFYRLLETPRTALDDWKNQLAAADDEFRSSNSFEQVRWVKFALFPTEPWRVYFQDCRKFPFHYDFATQRLAPFVGMSREAFDQATLHLQGQQLVLGAVLFPPRSNLNEFAVQFVGLDEYSPAQIAAWMGQVGNAVHSATGAQPLYMPVYEQAETARREATTLAQLGVTVASIDRWTTLNPIDFTPQQNSSRVPLGAQVMEWETDYAQFANLFAAVGNAWRQLTPARPVFSLDFEYKKDANHGLVVKQVREIPAPAAAAPLAPWIIEEPNLSGQPTTVTSDLAILEAPRSLTPGSIRVERVLDTGRGITVRTVVYWPDIDSAPVAGYTAPLVKFESTTLTGLLPHPIVLRGYYSQTYRPGHHNFTEEFIFEPALDPELPASDLSALNNAGIQALYIQGGVVGTPAFVISPAGKLSAR